VSSRSWGAKRGKRGDELGPSPSLRLEIGTPALAERGDALEHGDRGVERGDLLLQLPFARAV
jgi:hypothetical protein